jgi:DNA-binding response OmpR family regulator
MHASRPRALVVDDDAALRMLVRVNLELDGFDVVEASTIEEADEAAREGAIDVALLDVHLKGCDTHSLRARLQAVGIPVALVTGSVDVDEYRGEADGVLTKPFDPTALVELARRLARVGV